MRLRMLRQATTPFGAFTAGQVVDVPDAHIAKSWCSAGIAMEEKSKEPKEIKASGLYWCSKCGCSHKIDSQIGIDHRASKSPAGVG